jgi:hypothetical protein
MPINLLVSMNREHDASCLVQNFDARNFLHTSIVQMSRKRISANRSKTVRGKVAVFGNLNIFTETIVVEVKVVIPLTAREHPLQTFSILYPARFDKRRNRIQIKSIRGCCNLSRTFSSATGDTYAKGARKQNYHQRQHYFSHSFSFLCLRAYDTRRKQGHAQLRAFNHKINNVSNTCTF